MFVSGATKCPDCLECQACSTTRCRQCIKGGKTIKKSELGSGFTYGQYLEWKKGKAIEKNSRC